MRIPSVTYQRYDMDKIWVSPSTSSLHTTTTTTTTSYLLFTNVLKYDTASDNLVLSLKIHFNLNIENLVKWLFKNKTDCVQRYSILDNEGGGGGGAARVYENIISLFQILIHSSHYFHISIC